MVRAAVSGAIDYSRADPTDINWRLKQKLVLQEMQRRETLVVLDADHRQWLAYVAHGSLTENSFSDVKRSATEAFKNLKNAIFPWYEKPKQELKNDTILKDEPQLDADTQKLVDQYKAWQAQLKKSPNEGSK